MEILIKRLHDQATLPVYGREASSGIDLFSREKVTIPPGERVTVPTGIALAVPVGYIGVVWNRHSLVIGEPVWVTSSIIDSGYREEVLIELTNRSTEERTFEAGEKIAQLFVHKSHRAQLIEAEDFSGTED